MSERRFSERRHHEGAWDTTTLRSDRVLFRVFLNYASFKRRGVTRLARKLRPRNIVLDLGSGSGAYGHWIRSTTPIRLVSVDWAYSALISAREKDDSAGLYVCADMSRLPFKSSVFDAFYTIDALGHIRNSNRVLDECERVLRNGGHFFLHSECSDYRNRWPDRELIRMLGHDIIAQRDGHVGLRVSTDLHSSLTRRFAVVKSYSPAGLLGWLIGYPEKYRRAFKGVDRPVLCGILGIFKRVKQAPLLGAGLRLVNACTNRLELLLGVTGGGSFFANGMKNRQNTGEPS